MKFKECENCGSNLDHGENCGCRSILGTCDYCGQSTTFTVSEVLETKEERNAHATLICKCPEAVEAARIKKQVGRANKRIVQVFGDEAAESGLKPIENKQAKELMKQGVLLISSGDLKNITMQISSICKAKISLTSKDIIKVERTETFKYQLEE